MIVIFWSGKAVGVNKRLLWTKKRMVLNPAYKAFKDGMAWTIKAHSEIVKGPIDVKLEVCLPKRMDSDSVVKPCLDALQEGGIIANDNQVRNINIVREYHKQGEPDRIGFFIFSVEEEK